jgi:septal ring factor EnvC (AmiA/AmiB activator)
MNIPKWLRTIGQWALTFGLSFAVVSWLIDGSFWLHFFIAAALSKGSDAAVWAMQHQRLAKDFQMQSSMFQIADEQLVKVSAQVDALKEEISTLQLKLETVEGELSDVQWSIHKIRFPVTPSPYE